MICRVRLKYFYTWSENRLWISIWHEGWTLTKRKSCKFKYFTPRGFKGVPFADYKFCICLRCKLCNLDKSLVTCRVRLKYCFTSSLNINYENNFIFPYHHRQMLYTLISKVNYEIVFGIKKYWTFAYFEYQFGMRDGHFPQRKSCKFKVIYS